MANGTTFASLAIKSVAGQQLTLGGSSYAVSDAGAAVPTDGTAMFAYCEVEGEIDGFLRFQFMDPETLEGAIPTSDLKTAEIKLTEAAAGAAEALIAEEVFPY
jgi:hypothetical protein